MCVCVYIYMYGMSPKNNLWLDGLKLKPFTKWDAHPSAPNGLDTHRASERSARVTIVLTHDALPMHCPQILPELYYTSLSSDTPS